MNAQDVHIDYVEIKPGTSLSTPEWSGLAHTMTMEERGFAILVVTLMHLRGWRLLSDLPDDDDLAFALHAKSGEVRRLRRCLFDIPHSVLEGQLQRVKHWPAWIVRELAA